MKYHQLCLFFILFIVSCQTTEEPLREIKEYTIEQFLGNEAVFGSSFSYDESRLLIGSNKTGIYNAWLHNCEIGKNAEPVPVLPVQFGLFSCIQHLRERWYHSAHVHLP